MPVYVPPGTIRNFGAFDKDIPVYTKQVNGYTVLARPPKKKNLGSLVMFELIDLIVLGGVSEMAIASKAAAAGVVVAEIAELVTEYVKLQSLGTDIAKTAESVSRAERIMAMAMKGTEVVGTKGARVAEVATEMFPRTARLIAEHGTIENASIAYKIYDKTKTGLDLLNKATEKQESAGDYFYKQTQIQKERVKKWRKEEQANFSQPTFTDEEKLANEKRQADIDEQNKLLAMQLTGRDKNWNYIYPSKNDVNKGITPTNTPTTTSSNKSSKTTSNVPITSNTAITHIATKKSSVNNWIDNRDYNNFDFNNQTPSVNQDWLQVNQNNVENIDGEKLQNYVENK